MPKKQLFLDMCDDVGQGFAELGSILYAIIIQCFYIDS